MFEMMVDFLCPGRPRGCKIFLVGLLMRVFCHLCLLFTSYVPF
uniref:Uncharacterized protein n=1 Tax=Rhizophora mucronata TaxID=61149 RepID=A0A2P2PL66_RHIMU